MCYTAFYCCVVLTSILSVVSSTYVVSEFTDPSNPGIFNHVVVNKNTGIIYMAAVNKIYKITPNLTLESSVKTGPMKDNPQCYPRDPFHCPTQELRPNFNKVLLIDYGKTQRLIACSTLFHGFCEKRDLQNITKKDADVYEPVVANDETSSTVAFIAPGPSPSQGEPQSSVMYVGATWTNVGLPAYRDLVPSFSSRNLTDFKIFYKSWSASSKQDIESQQRDRFRVEYVYGFSSDNFSYMVTKQKKNTYSSKYISKMIRICQNDKRYYSYAEVPLNCSHQGTMYNIVRAARVGKAGTELAQSLGIALTEDVLYAVFSKSPAEQEDSAMCVFPLTRISDIFTQNIKKCFDGEGSTGPGHIIRPTECFKSKYSITKDYCGDYEINRPIDGTIPISSEAVIKFASPTNATAIAVTTTHDYTVAFVGLYNGHLKKVSIQSSILAEEYDDIVIEEGSPISKDLTFDLEKNHLYVMTERKLSKLKVQDCTRYMTCNKCLGARDPYCGWCSLENRKMLPRCSIRNECREPDVDLRWLPYNGAQCTTISSVAPSRVQIQSGKRTLLMMMIQNLPPLSSQYQCAFSGYGVVLITMATRQENGVQCETPETTDLPQIPKGSDHIVMSLSLRMNKQDFVSTNFTFFSCDVHKHCTNCTQSNFPCTWCVQNHMCTQYSENCVGDELVTGQSNLGNSDNPGPANCPRIEATSTKIYVPSGTRKTVTVKAMKLKPFQGDLKCFFNMDGGRQVAAVIRNNGDIECGAVEFSYYESQPSRNVAFQITWGGHNHALDNPTNIQVIMYKCSAMASSCGACLTMDDQYKCGWCDSRCTIQEQCSQVWLPSASTCPDPKIFKIIPSLGPSSGGTNLTIIGENLGKTFADIDGGITIAGEPCTPYREEYVAARKIVCKTGDIGKISRTPVKMTINGLYKTESDQEFHYVEPVINDIKPRIGPQAGGTSLTISGKYMNAGTKREATVDNLPCFVTSFTENQVVCTTSESSEELSGHVTLRFDNASLPLEFRREFFKYVTNPTVTKIVEEKRKSIVSGGLSLDVNGSNFDAIQNPKLIFWVGNQSYFGQCSHKDRNGRQLNCSTPSLATAAEISNISRPKRIAYGFEMDNVEDLRNLSSSEEYGVFIIFPDPSFDAFKEGMMVHRKNNEYLTINGKHILPGVDRPDVKVFVGKGECNVTSVATNQLTCKPPLTQPEPVIGSGYPEVYIRIGNLTFELGYLKYEEPEVLNNAVKIGLGVGAGFILLLIIIFLIAYYVKYQESDTMLKRYQSQMDQLSMKVAKECKEAFAELQTDMTELTSDLSGQVAIPFWDYRTFAMHVLFPTDEQHAVMRELEVEVSKKEHIDKGLKLFAQLMNNKTFLLIFVRTLETNKDFSMRDRVNVASLISVALQSKMEYATDILKTLLAELIEKSVEGKNHPKLLLRRTESVAEKMLTNWFTFLLYRFLKDSAGEPLFLLFQAIKQQVAKGPVDSITSEARYALGEDKLIRQQIDYRQMTVYVMDIDAQFGQQEHVVKVLDCDTISQVKEKILDAIFKNAAFSSRPTKEDLDLVLFDQTPEWNRGPQGKLILQDEDGTSKQEGDYKRLNTLAHYKVPDSSYLALVAKQSSMYNISLMSDKSKNLSYYNTRSPSLGRTVSPQAIYVDVDKDKDTKCYHLVKPHDSESHKEGDRGSKMVSEVYLTRLLKTKGTLQQFVDDLFDTIFSTTHRGSALPLAIKYMFDFLDDQALHHNIQDPEVVHTWKSNSLPLRFWVNVMKNPNFVFDIYKSNIVDSCLSVVAQTFMDSCSMREHRLGINSPSSKLLYAQDIPRYKKWVERYYQDIKMMPAISDQDMNALLAEESRTHQNDFNSDAALYELYKYVCVYNEGLVGALEEDEFARKNKLRYKLDQVHAAMQGEVSFC
ncbi:plexin-A2-like isoform X2 [Liolophura sinensis]|uniref:plexin-A2-like isoform X2 n=1 Tax=Liolophura sinensis TaxID=3198878 RepID=UPI00315811A5